MADALQTQARPVRKPVPVDITFGIWITRVDLIMVGKNGKTHDMMEDWTWREQYESGIDARTAVEIYLQEI